MVRHIDGSCQVIADTREVLVKLGMALYLHRGLIKRAEEARDSLDYFKALGIL